MARAGCAAEPSRGRFDLMNVTNAADRSAGGYPFPGQLAVRGTQVLAPLANLKLADCGGGYMEYCEPAGHGRLAVIDAAAADVVSIVDLGAGCGNPGGVAAKDATAWVSCGSFAFPQVAPGALVAVDLSGGAPKLDGAPVDALRDGPLEPRVLRRAGVRHGRGVRRCGPVRSDQPRGGRPGDRVPDDPPTTFTFAADIACP